MNTQKYTPIPNNLALTIVQEHKLVVFKKATRDTLRVSLKTLLYTGFLFLSNILF